MRKKINNLSTSELVKCIDEYKKFISNKVIPSRKLSNKLLVHTKNYGDVFIIDYYFKNGDRYFIGQFKKTSFLNDNIHYSQIKTGEIKDLRYRKIHNIGYLDDGFYDIIKDKELHKSMYNRWVNMLSRCYNKNSIGYKIYGKKGVYVCDRWHSYTNFFIDATNLPGFSRDEVINGSLTLDKDKLQQGIDKSNMCYSKNTCCWLSVSEQNSLVDHNKAQSSLKKSFIVTHPNGKTEYITGIGEFARKYNLDPCDCSRAINGKIKHVKNYKFKALGLE